jgi:CspA family cold shock protein
MTMRGEIKRLKLPEGFGFIKAEDGEDYFFHRSCLRRGGPRFEELRERMPVEFEPKESMRGPRAEDVAVVSA